jgi:hypothetical protein
LVVGSEPDRKWGLGRGGILKDLLKLAVPAGLDIHIIASSPVKRIKGHTKGGEASSG